jgi:hypothetical protein
MKLTRFFQKLSKVYLFCLFAGGFCFSSVAQMSHSSHSTMKLGSQTKTECSSTNLECANAANPFLSEDGKLHLIWTANGSVSYAQSIDLGKSWSPALEIANHGKALDTGSDARPQIIVNREGQIFIAYAFFKDKNWNAQVNYSVSEDGGKSFTTPKSIVNDTSSQRFPSLLMRSDGSLFLSWIDKRLIRADKEKGNKALGASLAFATSNNFGKSLSSEQISNPLICECCRIGASLDSSDRPVLIYRAIFEGGIRDHASQIFGPNGASKIERVSNDGWKTDACPHHGPSIAVSSSNTSHVAWFTQGSERSGLFYSRSVNGNSKFSSPVRIGIKDTNLSRPFLMTHQNYVWLTWKEFDGKQTLIWLQNSMDDGITWSAPQVVSKTNDYSDHPLLIKHNQHMYLSWLTQKEGYQIIPISKLP